MVEEWFKKLRELSLFAPVLVEGKRDRQALQKHGVKNIITLEGKRFTDLPDLLDGFSSVILLFDLDKHGEKINSKVREILRREGYILIEELREKLKEMGIRFVEELNGKVSGLQQPSGSGQAHKAQHSDA